jgi:AraC-like DNA-binding protein
VGLFHAAGTVLNGGMETIISSAIARPGESATAVRADQPSGYEMHRRRLDPRLAGMVSDIVGYRENGEALHLSPEMATMVVPLIISFAEPFEIAFGRAPSSADRVWSFTSGLYPGFVLINSYGAAECVQIDFTPLGAYRFFGLPMSELTSRKVTLGDLGDRALEELRERLALEPDWDRRLDIAEDFVATRLESGRPASAEVAWAFETILARQGSIRVRDVAAGLDWSRKHLNDRFREEVGVGPKSLARMARFNHALALARNGTEGGWAEIAAASGYADQAHMVREFREFGGITPTGVTPELFEGRR